MNHTQRILLLLILLLLKILIWIVPIIVLKPNQICLFYLFCPISCHTTFPNVLSDPWTESYYHQLSTLCSTQNTTFLPDFFSFRFLSREWSILPCTTKQTHSHPISSTSVTNCFENSCLQWVKLPKRGNQGWMLPHLHISWARPKCWLNSWNLWRPLR